MFIFIKALSLIMFVITENWVPISVRKWLHTKGIWVCTWLRKIFYDYFKGNHSINSAQQINNNLDFSDRTPMNTNYETWGPWHCNKQLLNKVGHDIMSYWCRDLSYPPKQKAKTDNTSTRFVNSYHTKNWIHQYFYFTFFKQSAKEDFSFWVHKSVV